MSLIVSKKKYKEALNEIKRMKKEHTEMRKDIVSKDIEINGLKIESDVLKNTIKTLEDKIGSLKGDYRDSEIELLLAMKKRCKKARVKTKYKNRILKIAEKRLLELERQA